MPARRLSILVVALAACIPHDDAAPRARSVAPHPSPTRAIESAPRRVHANAPPIEDACAALSQCCAGLDVHARPYCVEHVQEGDALSCALSYHWSACCGKQLPD